MEPQENLKVEKKRFYYAVFFPEIISFLMVLSFFFERGMGWDFTNYGIEPRHWNSLLYIFFTPFIHGTIWHLLHNVVAFFVLSVSLYYFYTPIANKMMVLSVIFSGILLWVIGRDNYHIGASGVVFALSFFLFFSGIIRRHIPLIAISLIVVFLYGNNVWHLFPWLPNDPISWEGHLAGGVTGLSLSIIYKNEGPQKPIIVWDDENDDDSDDNTRWNENVDDNEVQTK
ncbi:MAG: rhomboid family intramembrane serine protease [Paludibacteraceae bacterium]